MNFCQFAPFSFGHLWGAESLALALTEYYQVPPENMVVQGYGEDFLLVPSEGPQRENRRVGVRRITDLLEQSGE